MREFIWRAVARFVSRPTVRRWLIARAQRTPYEHIRRDDGTIYMGRWWLFNPYLPKSDGKGRRWSWLPSIRIHHIVRPDVDTHMHDHPWDARTIVLDGWYMEQRPCNPPDPTLELDDPRRWPDDDAHSMGYAPDMSWCASWTRAAGYTGTLSFGQFHRVAEVSEGGVWTLFLTWESLGTWGFLVNGKRVPWREYLAGR